ncbi:MAG: hypothetical protein IKD28_05980 [Clostridia bacterium]|nr:hypothetical protein [Clostridia bacterium]
MTRSAQNRPFPKILLTLGVLAVALLILYLTAIAPDAEAVGGWFRTFGEFICKYDTVLIGFLIVVNLVELADAIYFAPRDQTINANYEVRASENLSMLAMFKQYFAGYTSRAPLIFASEERQSALPRLIICAATAVIKFICWIFLAIAIVAMIAKPEVYDYAMAEGADYGFTVVVLYLFLNSGFLVYALYRMLPLHESRTYEVTTYYSDGSQSTSKETQTNLFAILILTAFLYLFYSSYYVLPVSSKLNRCIETLRFKRFLDEQEDDCYIGDFY